jgi:hypothetical protein
MSKSDNVTVRPQIPALSLLVVVVLIALIALTSSEDVLAALTDKEPPLQYEDWDTAYDLSLSETGTAFDVRKEGGGDRDYIRMAFLSPGDIVSVHLNNYGDPHSQVEYWIHDPNRFPIANHQYDGSGDPNATLRFNAIGTGPYFLHFGQGFGTTFIRVNITVTTDTWTGDGNDLPTDAEEVANTKVINSRFGQPGDPADFYKLMLDPSPSLKTFLSFSLTGTGWSRAQWELYNSTGILRPNPFYSQDLKWSGKGTDTFDERILEPETYYLRLWCIEGSGDYRLYVNIVTYVEDGDDWMEGASELVDGQTVNGTLHTMYDMLDHYHISLDEGDVLQLWMDVDDDADLFVLEEDGWRVASSDNWDDGSEFISYTVPPGGSGTYYVRVVMSTELDPIPSRVISYQLRVVANLPPELDEDMAKSYGSWPMLEDRVDEGILLTDLFHDPEGGPLTFRVVPGHNESWLNATLTGAHRLRLEPAENVSGFVMDVTVEAMDVKGKTTRFTVSVAVIAVNDAPIVGHPTLGPPPDVLEVDEDTDGGPWDILFWFWDSDNLMTELIFSFETDLYLNAKMDDMDRLVIVDLVDNWNGQTNITIRVRDPEGLGALIRMPVVVKPVNDPPRRMIEAITIDVSGGVVASIDVASHFMDEDWDILTFMATSDLDLAYVIDGSRITVEGLLQYQNMTVDIIVKAMDPEEMTSDPLVITLDVKDMEDPHTLTANEEEYTMLWGIGRFLTDVALTDPDLGTCMYDVLLSVGDWNDTYQLKRTDNRLAWQYPRPYWAPEWGSPEVDVVVTMTIWDEWYTANVSWIVHVRATNSPPEIISIGPDRPGPYNVGDQVTFNPEATDEEGDPMIYTWYHDGNHAGSSQNLTLTMTSTGEQKVELLVSDGFNVTEAQYEFLVVAQDTSLDPPIMAVMLILIGSVAAIGLVVYVFYRRRGPA